MLPRYARFAGGLVLFIGAAALVGWWTGTQWLTSVLPRWPPMMANTAVLGVLSGASLLMLSRAAAPPWASAAGRACAAAACVLASLTLVEYAVGVRLSIDQLVVRTARVSVARFPGRPAVNTAIAFLLAGAALLALPGRGARRPRPRLPKVAQILAAASGSIAVFALLGYVFDIRGFYSVPPSHPETGMALHTAIMVVALASGILAARPDAGLMSIVTSAHAGGVMARRLSPGILAFLPVALLVLVGERRGWYDVAVAAALLVFLALIESGIFILVTAHRLNLDDVARGEVEARVQQSERQYRDLIENASDGIFIADLDGRYTEVNDAACRMLGVPREQIVGKTIVDLIPPEEVERLWRVRQELLEGGTTISEWKLRCHDGTFIPVEVSSTVLADGRWQAFVRDVRERKRVEAELEKARATDQRLRAELEQVTRASMSVSEVVADLPQPDISAVLQTIALQAQSLTGAKYVGVGLGSDADEPFDPWIHLGVPEESGREIGRNPRPVGILGEVAREGRVVRVRAVMPEPAFGGFPPHHPVMRSFLGVPIRYRGRSVGNLYLADKQGALEFSEQDQRLIEMLAARAAVAIETAKLYAGEAMQRAWLNATIDQMPEGVILLDKAGRAVAMNRAILALSSGDTDGLDPYGNPDLFDVRTPEGEPVSFDDLAGVRALTAGESTMGRELIARVADGRMVPILVNAAPVRDDQGAITGATVVVQDITTARELARLREEWASVVAHDLRQPVGTISLTAQALSRMRPDELPEKERKAIERIQTSSERLNRMIDDLLDASLIDASRMALDRQAVDLRALIGTVVESLREVPAGRRVRVAAQPQQIAWVDPDRIQQVLENLISNAFKYGRPDTEIHVLCTGHDEVIEVTVTNRGPGIPPDELPRLFNRFQRSKQARADRAPGLGLGLYISKGLVEAHGGRMWAESVPGEATAFHFTVPRAPPAPDYRGAAVTPPAPSGL